MSIIENKMHSIRTIFQDARDFAMGEENIDAIVKQLSQQDSDFNSVAYEGASMSLALKDFTDNNTLKRWDALLNVSEAHAGQIHIGLGWAIAKSKPADLSFMETINPKFRFRVWDGCGYYDGLFLQRQPIKNHLRADYITEKEFSAYDEGIGRSLWYACKGDVDLLPEMIQPFASARHSDLWRGIGIACSYVGGCDESSLKKLLSLANEHRIQLSIAAAMVAKSRTHANRITKDIELACNVWCHLSVHDAMQLTVKADSTFESFTKWLATMETAITNTSNVI